MVEGIFDIETDGLLQDVTEVKCGVINDQGYYSVSDFNKELDSYDTLVGHNIIGYDLPVLKKLFGWTPRPGVKIFDTLLASRLIFTNRLDIDFKLYKDMEPKLKGRHSLESYGERFKLPKMDMENDDLLEYCKRDVQITNILYNKIKNLSFNWEESLTLEHEFATVIERQVAHGFHFNQVEGAKLYAKLLEDRTKVASELRTVFGSWYQPDGEFTPKKNNQTRGYTSGCKFTRVKLVDFNPGSRDHIANRLKKKYGWSPKQFTDGGKPQIDETVLAKLKYPECNKLSEHFLLDKRIAQLAEGDKAWLKHVTKEGRIHGGVITNGAVTGRCTHNNPNIAQVPASYSLYGKDCRALFGVPHGKTLVGCDADGLELRCLAHFMFCYDAGAYAVAAVEGNSKDGTDIHTINMRAIGVDLRDIAKTFFYAFIYGAGDGKLGSIVGKGRKEGKILRKKFLANVKGLKELTEQVQKEFNDKGYLVGLDGRKLQVRSEHSALNTKLQSAGAVIMKKALVILDKELQKTLVPGIDYEFVANVHDEFQIEVSNGHVETVKEAAGTALTLSGIHYNFKCRITGSAQEGRTWADTH